MADFKTHLVGAAAVTGLVDTLLVMTRIAPKQAVVVYFMCGVIGGLLPDIDSRTAIPIRIAYAVLSVAAGFLVAFTFGARYSLIELLLLWAGCFLLIRYGFLEIVSRCTVHRGLVHSVPAGIGFGAVTTVLAFHVFQSTALHAWLCGLFVILGFLTHLLLDEWYSVNLYGKRLLKKSFGTAFCFGSFKQPLSTVALYVAVVGLLLACPPPRPVIDRILDRAASQEVAQRLAPRETWFRGLLPR